ncbi:YcxB family protein [Sphingomonas sp. LM7]|uniref:YcxB family protein n=1 Tax=Sphingomonas sp. LM7 TaxID=1938607 RepID=UPI0009838C48|nr:YcxB family protein [Sphingomonas sp. LM7]AQR74620.1 hypothetical protein BXU08_14040 [Sphingomonas sp. LM7]
MPLEHHEPLSWVTFSLDAETQIAASRANFRRQMRSRRTLTRIAIAVIVFAGIGLGIGFLLGDADPASFALILGGEAIVIFPVLFLALYAVIPRRVRRLVRQNPVLGRPIEACWSSAGLSARGANGTSELAWSDFYGWHRAEIGFLLYLNDQLYHVIPGAVLSRQQQDRLCAILETSGLRRL